MKKALKEIKNRFNLWLVVPLRKAFQTRPPIRSKIVVEILKDYAKTQMLIEAIDRERKNLREGIPPEENNGKIIVKRVGESSNSRDLHHAVSTQ